ncbi:MAG: hypothetical protein HC896_17725 [Bacteroidales bacterium]|nr:hypothetical protein [Bacteroidales bacterium]
MIIPMRKYSFLVYHKDLDKFLADIQEIGLVHVVRKQEGLSEDEALMQLQQQIKKTDAAIATFEKHKTDEVTAQPSLYNSKTILSKLDETQLQLDKIEQEKQSLQKEMAHAAPWGEFDAGYLNKLNSAGLRVNFYTCPEKAFMAHWETDFNAFRIAEQGSKVFLLQ